MEDGKLRVLHVVVQPVLVWDNGEELEQGPEVQPQAIPFSALAGLAEQITSTLPELAEQILKQAQAENGGDGDAG